MAHTFNTADHVLADFDGNGYVVAHIVNGPDQDGKHGVQKPDGNVARLAHREENDLDANGSGGTFKHV